MPSDNIPFPFRAKCGQRRYTAGKKMRQRPDLLAHPALFSFDIVKTIQSCTPGGKAAFQLCRGTGFSLTMRSKRRATSSE